MATVNWNSPAVIARAQLGAVRGVLSATEDVRNEAIRLILNTAKTGRIYRRRTVTHQASGPGEAPASDTGRLVNSIRTEYSGDGLQGTVIASTAYAEKLEYGTPRMAPRPFMRPALVNRLRAIDATIRAAVMNAVGV